MRISEIIKQKIDCGDMPTYRTKRGKLLWIDEEHYNSYSSAMGCKILIGADDKFWGYSDNPNIVMKGGSTYAKKSDYRI